MSFLRTISETFQSFLLNFGKNKNWSNVNKTIPKLKGKAGWLGGVGIKGFLYSLLMTMYSDLTFLCILFYSVFFFDIAEIFCCALNIIYFKHKQNILSPPQTHPLKINVKLILLFLELGSRTKVHYFPAHFCLCSLDFWDFPQVFPGCSSVEGRPHCSFIWAFIRMEQRSSRVLLYPSPFPQF